MLTYRNDLNPIQIPHTGTGIRIVSDSVAHFRLGLTGINNGTSPDLGVFAFAGVGVEDGTAGNQFRGLN